MAVIKQYLAEVEIPKGILAEVYASDCVLLGSAPPGPQGVSQGRSPPGRGVDGGLFQEGEKYLEEEKLRCKSSM